MSRQKEFTFHKKDFKYLAEEVYSQTGIVLKEHKYEMVYARLARRLRALKLANFKDYISLLEGPGRADEMAFLVDSITTNLTKFFREGYQMKHLVSEVLRPAVERAKAGGERKLRIWSAGCSSGQEAYTIAIVLNSVIKDLNNWDVKVLATDIDRNMLNKASKGIYSAKEASSLPPNFFKRYTKKVKGTDAIEMQDCLKDVIAFKPLNLLGDFPFKGQFDAIFCRNVVIYFDDVTKKELLKKFIHVLRTDGYLYLGHSEALMAAESDLVSCGRASFRKKA